MSDVTFKTETYDDGSLRSRKTLNGHTVKSHNGFISVLRHKDDEIVFAGTYAMLKARNPNLEV